MSSYVPQYQWHKPLTFDELDANADGSISLDELESTGKNVPTGKSGNADERAQALLKKLDTDGNGSVSKDERSAFQSRLSGRMQSLILQCQEMASVTQSPSATDITQGVFAKIDANGDGSISQDELNQFLSSPDGSGDKDRIAQLFNAIDTNQDGKIGKDENSASAAKPHRHHDHHGHAGASAAMSGLVDGSFDALDTNHDGVVSTDELAAAGINSGATKPTGSSESSGSGDSSTTSKGITDLFGQLFKQMDGNGDGQVTSDEKQGFKTQVKQAFAQWATEQYNSAANLTNHLTEPEKAAA
jgi:Ca2+-binding EF-hand superfamily protein